jgi:nucleotide-binding universal stress UspA family protein
MSLFASILVPLDGSAAAAKSLDVATWLAGRMDARLHLHQAPDHAAEGILAAIASLDVDLVVMSARGKTAELPAAEAGRIGIVGHVTRTVIERSRVPVLLLPPAYREQLPWERALVPVSGEAETDEALTLTVRLANVLDLEVHVAHVTGDEPGAQDLAAAARYADAPHHEFRSRLVELVSRTLPPGASHECRCIKDVALTRGDVAGELLRMIKERHVSLLAVGWHGRFMTGHAHVLKRLVETVSCPVLLVQAPQRKPFKLRVGEEIE